jgi:hypothetical protein
MRYGLYQPSMQPKNSCFALRLGLRREVHAVDELALERREEALTHRVVVAVAHGSH